ncbi:Kinase, WNK [Spironucleus salmonicida]|uniref:Kinase, WNK n=1 Tax=Spironucleus salmonicida TaxID=348837 RepID=V6M129_9EUKA|nr:Kinase, WNK [Spironucleus salmonicida]|eukprot:EST46874.1 Kinase, WNK [Spironucleus salmonicida]
MPPQQFFQQQHDLKNPAVSYIKYEDCIGVGSFKRVFRCINIFDGKEYAWNEVSLEKLDPISSSKIFQEIKFYQILSHPNIIKIYHQWFNEQNTLIFITELISGGSLRDFIKKIHAPFKLKVIQDWSRQILSALQYLHSMNILHRDLKAQNIYYDYTTNIVKIGDLGLSTTREFQDIEIVYNKQMSMVGTSEFMAPEIYFQQYTEKVDIYAFGMCMCEFFTKEFPYQECKHTMEIYNKVMAGVLPECVKKITNTYASDLISLCLQNKPEKRPSIAQILQTAFMKTIFNNEIGSSSTPQIGALRFSNRNSNLRLNIPASPSSVEKVPPQIQLKVQNYPPITQVSSTSTILRNAPQENELAQDFSKSLGCFETADKIPFVKLIKLHVKNGIKIIELQITVGEHKYKWPVSEEDVVQNSVEELMEVWKIDSQYQSLITDQFNSIWRDIRLGILESEK